MKFAKIAPMKVYMVSLPTLPMNVSVNAATPKEALQRVLTQAYGNIKKNIEKVKRGEYNAIVTEVNIDRMYYYRYAIQGYVTTHG